MVIPIGKTYVALGEDVFEKIKVQVRVFDQCEAFTSVGLSDVPSFLSLITVITASAGALKSIFRSA